MKRLRIASLACALSLMTITVQAQDAVEVMNEAIAAAGKRNVGPAAQRLQGFSVALLLGETKGSTTPDGLSAPARKALADISSFLPYKAYRVLDTQWVAGTERAPAIQLKLRGLGSQDYQFRMESLRVLAGAPMSARVTLRTPPIDEATRLQAMARMAQLEDLVRTSGVPASSGLRRAEAEREIAQLKQTLAGGQTLIDTTLSIGMGETVVVGTSRVQGDTALIVLLTAVAR
jgi:hypothetical protein